MSEPVRSLLNGKEGENRNYWFFTSDDLKNNSILTTCTNYEIVSSKLSHLEHTCMTKKPHFQHRQSFRHISNKTAKDSIQNKIPTNFEITYQCTEKKLFPE